MSFNADLSIDGGDKIRLLHVSFELHREVDATGRPSSHVKGGQINLEIEATDNISVFEWMVDQYTHKKGVVTFNKRDAKSKMVELKWENGYVIQYSTALDAVGDNPMTIHFVVSAETIEYGSAKHTNPWPKS